MSNDQPISDKMHVDEDQPQQAELTKSEARAYVHNKVKLLRAQAYCNNQPVSADAFDGLERLDRLNALYNATLPPPERKWWLPVMVFGFVLFVVGILHLLRLSTADIELNMSVTDVGFVAAEPWPIIEKLVIQEMGVFDVGAIQLPGSAQQAGRTVSAEQGMAIHFAATPPKDKQSAGILTCADPNRGTTLTIAPCAEASPQGTITFSDLMLPEHTQVWISHTDLPHQFRLELLAPQDIPLTLDLDLEGDIRIRSAHLSQMSDEPVTGPVRLKAVSNYLGLDLTLPAGEMLFPPQLRMTDLQFMRIDRSRKASGIVDRPLSTIRSGTLYFTTFADRKHTLRSGESLALKDSSGVMRNLTVREKTLDLQFHGTVSGVSAGWEQQPQNLMPTRLEALRATPWIKSYWPTVLSVFTVLLGALRWWRTRK